MSCEAIFKQNTGQQDYTPASASLAGEISQLADGRAAVTKADLAASEKGSVYTEGIFGVLCGTSVTFAVGEEVWWDASADTAIVKGSAASGDFCLGKCTVANASGDLIVWVDLNVGVFNGLMRFGGKVVGVPPVSPTANISVTASGHGGKTILCTSLCRKVSLPLANVGLTGLSFTIVNAYAVGGASIECWVDPASADKINLGTTGIGLRLQQTADAVGDHLTVICDGSNWYTTARFGTWAASTV